MPEKLPVANEQTNGALLCGRMTFIGGLTVSVNGWAQSSLLETIMMFTGYFSDKHEDRAFEKLELFRCEADMHTNQPPWQITTFA